jgi:hypothetical protein
MTVFPRRARSALAVLAMGLAASGCYHPSADRVHASAATRAACRARADEVYLKQNRAEIYQQDSYTTSTRDSPYAASGLPGITTDGLGGQYQREQMQDDCINASDGRVVITNPEPSAAAPASLPSPGIQRGTALPPPRP